MRHVRDALTADFETYLGVDLKEYLDDMSGS